MDKIKVALIGCGGITRSHAAAYEALTDRAQVVYCVDPNPDNARERAETLGAEPVASYDGIVDQVDAVDICTPHHLHYPQARDALEAGCHALVEKPMANERDECVELADIADRQNKHLMVAYVLRFMPAMQKLKEVLASGTYGDVIQIATSVEANVTEKHLPWAASKEKLGGGVLFSHGCHTVDLMVWMCGVPKTVAMFGNHVNAEWMEGEGTAQVIMQFAEGALGHHTSSWAMANANRIPTMRVWCRDGFLEVAGQNLNAWVGREREVLYDWESDDKPVAMTRQIEHYIDCCRTGDKPLTDGRTAIASLNVIWGAYESWEKGEVVTLD